MTTGFWSFLSPSLFVFLLPFCIGNVLLFFADFWGSSRHILFQYGFLIFTQSRNVTWKWGFLSIFTSLLIPLFLLFLISLFLYFPRKEKNRIWNYFSLGILFCRFDNIYDRQNLVAYQGWMASFISFIRSKFAGCN